MALPNSFYGQTLIDYSNESSSWSVAVSNLTAANVAAQATLITALESAVLAVTLGAEKRSEITFLRDTFGPPPPTNPLSQRENKWLVRYVGANTGKLFSVELPCADLSLLSTSPQSDFMIIATGAGATLVSAFEAVVKSPDDPAEAVIVRNIQFVGRRL